MTERIDRNLELAEERTHLANQRTFLAWIRAGLSLIGFGFGINKFILFLREFNYEFLNDSYPATGNISLIVSVILVFSGVITVFLSFIGYQMVEKRLNNKYNSYGWLLFIVVFLVMSGGAIILYDLLINFKLI
ncbi:MAG: DUF202 domain-containing protein [Chitinophagales bacterium]|nr:DUF202 domain-containing protein [Chitinophagales bacterium]